jgi:YhcH/YjgK/YiaL family protein
VGKSKDAAKMETHNKYIDIQMPLTTTETMGWKATKELKKITQPYNEEKDITFFADTPTTYIQVQPGEFAIFFPEDGHAPGIAEGNFKKVIVKVRI